MLEAALVGLLQPLGETFSGGMMQSITIGVTRTRDMRTVHVHAQFRDSGPGGTTTTAFVGAVTYAHPFTLDRAQTIELGDLVLKTVKAQLAQPLLPF